jgi:hypothetical protein
MGVNECGTEWDVSESIPRVKQLSRRPGGFRLTARRAIDHSIAATGSTVVAGLGRGGGAKLAAEIPSAGFTFTSDS